MLNAINNYIIVCAGAAHTDFYMQFFEDISKEKKLFEIEQIVSIINNTKSQLGHDYLESFAVYNGCIGIKNDEWNKIIESLKMAFNNSKKCTLSAVLKY